MEIQIGTICSADIGASTTKISALLEKGFQILVNQANFRQTPSIVGYTKMQRMIGQQGLIKQKTNFKNTVRSPLRLIIAKTKNALHEELKYSTNKYKHNNELQFAIEQNNQQLLVKSQQILIALLTKILAIIYSHQISVKCLCLSIPTFFNSTERRIVYQCSKVVNVKKCMLIDDWQAISTDYAYFRFNQLQNQPQSRYILFLDVGHSKFCAYVCEISRFHTRLIAQKCLKYTGGRNMDNLILQYYSQQFAKNVNKKIEEYPKSLIKMLQNIEKQRKILSANNQHHLNIQCLIGEEDFQYCLKRQQFQNIIMPTLGQIASALNEIKQQIQAKFIKLKSIQIIGGCSRIPFFQQMVSDIFKIQLSRTLNASQSIARGANIIGAIQTNEIKQPNFKIQHINLTKIKIYWNDNNKEIFGKNLVKYQVQNSKILFDRNIRVPVKQTINFLSNVVEFVIVYDNQGFNQIVNCYSLCEGPCSIRFQLDQNKLLTAQHLKNQQTQLNLHEINHQTWKQYQKLQEQMRLRDQRILEIYHKKNQYEALLYQSKDKVNNQLTAFMSENQKNSALQIIQQGQQWIGDHQGIADLQQYIKRIQTLLMIISQYEQRKDHAENLQPKYIEFIKVSTKALTLKSNQKIQEVQKIKFQIQQAYKKKQLTSEQCDKARKNIIQICVRS